MKKALITGITGQDGSYLAEFLLEKGYEVHGIVRRASISNTARIDHLIEKNVIALHDGDLSRVQKRRFSSKGGARTFWESGFSKPVKKSIKDVKSVTLASSDLPRRETTRGTIAYRKNRKLGKPSTHD